MDGSDGIAVAASGVLRIIDNPKRQRLKYTRAVSSQKNSGGSQSRASMTAHWGSVFCFLCSTFPHFQPQNHVKVQENCWNMQLQPPGPLSSTKEEGFRMQIPAEFFSLQGAFLEVPDNILFIFMTSQNPFGVCSRVALNLETEYEKCYIPTSKKLFQCSYTLETGCTISIDQTGHLLKKYNKNVHCSFWVPV